MIIELERGRCQVSELRGSAAAVMPHRLLASAAVPPAPTAYFESPFLSTFRFDRVILCTWMEADERPVEAVRRLYRYATNQSHGPWYVDCSNYVFVEQDGAKERRLWAESAGGEGA